MKLQSKLYKTGFELGLLTAGVKKFSYVTFWGIGGGAPLGRGGQPSLALVMEPPDGRISFKATQNYFAKLLDDASTTPFPRKLDLFLQGSAHWNIRRDLRPFGDLPNGLGVQEGCFKQCYTRLNHECTHKTQLTHTRINCVLKDSSYDTPLSKILKLTILGSNASSSSTKVCPYFPINICFSSLKIKKGLFKACNGVECKENQFDTWLVTTRCKEFTYFLCNFTWSHRSCTFMFVQLRALFESSILIKTETQIC
ncbi:hypothetical protein H5410_022315 [Solanum commersonii]|uniref:Uncharacterized protein n=1 Tax=Solanum commersonii TaxID=4109 RepID=A0A9J5ZEF6_SOLCO|nr:hypothetical protein H5410_022315 [Solanum commersonii]